MPAMTKAQHAKHERLAAKLKTARDRVYAAAHPRRDVRFSDCLAMADANVRQQYEDADAALCAFESEMVVAQCRAWRSSHGVFTPYRR